MNPSLAAHNVSKRFGNIRALQNVDVSLLPGECHGLIGENGAGKSTLIKIFTGIIHPTEGAVWVDGTECPMRRPQDAIDQGIVAVHQELTLVDCLSIAENIWLGHELYCAGGMLDRKAMIRKAGEAMRQYFAMENNPADPVSTLTLHEKQRVEILKALSKDPQILIFDEATAALPEADIDRLYDIVQRFKQDGRTIVFVSHRMNEIFRFCDSCTILRDGQMIIREDVANLDENKMIEYMAGQRLVHDVHAVFGVRRNLENAPVMLDVKDMCTESGLKGITFQLKKGEIVGLGGLQGQGQDPLLDALFGLEKIVRGTVVLDGREILLKSPARAIRYGIHMVHKNRKIDGLFLHLDVQKNLIACSLQRLASFGWLKGRLIRKKVAEVTDRFSIKVSGPWQTVSTLSGGNQQKISLGRCMTFDAKLLLLNEPTRGIDVMTKGEIYRHLKSLAEQGYSILFASTEISELIGLSDRIFMIYENQIVRELREDDITENNVLSASFGNDGDVI